MAVCLPHTVSQGQVEYVDLRIRLVADVETHIADRHVEAVLGHGSRRDDAGSPEDLDLE